MVGTQLRGWSFENVRVSDTFHIWPTNVSGSTGKHALLRRYIELERLGYGDLCVHKYSLVWNFMNARRVSADAVVAFFGQAM